MRPAMRVAIVSALAAPLVHCRGVLGIEDLRYDGDGGSEASSVTDAAAGSTASGASKGSAGSSQAASSNDASGAADASGAPPADASRPPSDGSAGTGGATDDAPAHPPPEAGMPPEGGMCPAGARCGECCVGPNPVTVVQAMIAHAMQAGCICGSNQCDSECSSSLCGGGAMPPPTCVDCIFDRLGEGACPSAVMACNNDPTCSPVVPCVRSCLP